ncbi:hypothetical protein BFJ68_g12880 [Fusarium oxysporum]|uniref:Uncharacterized protein n=1 Tax=Fusarium oxysporum TaxID=5507 RepID=A0A420Q5Y2_FUSOX|nr:hypothetical protein BFJ71_g8926 [Fusarium oxysporum]RKL00195.1 hypothetical protein BFJ68_g12880 [Fusarium oxysporum]
MDQYIKLHKKPSRAMSTVALTLAQSNLVRRHRDNTTTDSRPHDVRRRRQQLDRAPDLPKAGESQ